MVTIDLQLDYAFTRAFPETAPVAKRMERRSLNYSDYYDCKTGKQLYDLSNLNCADPYQKDKDGKYIIDGNG